MVAPTSIHFAHETYLLLTAGILLLSHLVKLLNDALDLWEKVTKNEKSLVHKLYAQIVGFFKKILNVLQTATMEHFFKKFGWWEKLLQIATFKKNQIPEFGIPQLRFLKNLN